MGRPQRLRIRLKIRFTACDDPWGDVNTTIVLHDDGAADDHGTHQPSREVPLRTVWPREQHDFSR